VLFVPVPELPFRSLSVPTVIVVHDVGPLSDPQIYPFHRRLRVKAALRIAAKRATTIVCVSEATRSGLHAALEIHAKHVIGEGPRRDVGEEPAGPSARPYALYVGSLLPHKNVETVAAAFTGSGDDELRIVGPVGKSERAALARWRTDLGINGRVSHLGYVEPKELATLYAGATAVVCPSLHEGFGLPAVEAMRLGVPVIAAAIPASMEVVGDAGLLIAHPRDASEWRSALDSLNSDSQLRERLSHAGRERSELFSWEEAGNAMAGVLLEAGVGC
jgi:glycosyltransferase involved in cell wall biosynthesis